MAAHQAPPSLGFSNQEHWSGLQFLLQCRKVKSESEVAQSCPTLRDPMDCSLPGSSVHGIFQARVLEWGAIAFSRPWSRHLITSSSLSPVHVSSVVKPDGCDLEQLWTEIYWNLLSTSISLPASSPHLSFPWSHRSHSSSSAESTGTWGLRYTPALPLGHL